MRESECDGFNTNAGAVAYHDEASKVKREYSKSKSYVSILGNPSKN